MQQPSLDNLALAAGSIVVGYMLTDIIAKTWSPHGFAKKPDTSGPSQQQYPGPGSQQSSSQRPQQHQQNQHQQSSTSKQRQQQYPSDNDVNRVVNKLHPHKGDDIDINIEPTGPHGGTIDITDETRRRQQQQKQKRRIHQPSDVEQSYEEMLQQESEMEQQGMFPGGGFPSMMSPDMGGMPSGMFDPSMMPGGGLSDGGDDYT